MKTHRNIHEICDHPKRIELLQRLHLLLARQIVIPVMAPLKTFFLLHSAKLLSTTIILRPLYTS